MVKLTTHDSQLITPNSQSKIFDKNSLFLIIQNNNRKMVNNYITPPTDFQNQGFRKFGEYLGSTIVMNKDIIGEYFNHKNYEDCLLILYSN